MFSANENIQLRNYKKKVVEYVESCIPEEALDMGTMVMAMQVSCKAPGCVPLETAIVIVFPKLDQELISGLPESRGGNYKTKVLKPMAEVTKDDVLEALPPEFPGGKRSLEKLCLQARDVMLGQITQLFADEDQQGRRLMADYLKECLKEYTDRDCTPPEWGEPFPPLLPEATAVSTSENGDRKNENNPSQETSENNSKQSTTTTTTSIDTAAPAATGVATSGNFVFKRPKEEDPISSSSHTFVPSITSGKTYNTSATKSDHQRPTTKNNNNTNTTTTTTPTSSSQQIMAQLGERQHAPGIRRPGCPCCDPENADNMIDGMMAL